MAILAQYTIRSKQAYIFRTNAMREITGGSALIRDAWEELFKVAEEVAHLTVWRLADGKAKIGETSDNFPASPGDFLQAEGSPQMIELFRGGGNDTVLFSDVECMKLANAAFTHAMLEKYPGMIPMCAYVEASENYKADYQKLMLKVEREKNRMAPGLNLAMAPFSMMDRKTFQPVVCREKEGTREVELTAEARAKWQKGKDDERTDQSNAMLDNIGSMLAVVHADGNNMGSKITQLLGGNTGYDVCVPLMRRFTRATAEAFTGTPKDQLDAYAKQKHAEAKQLGDDNDYILRWIVNDGDDATFVCSAERALELTQYYLEKVAEQEDISVQTADNEPFRFNSCAGICLFHSHYPYSMAYAMAEEACDSAKEKVHGMVTVKRNVDGQVKEEKRFREEAWIDFHIIHSGLNDDLNDLRTLQNTRDRIARPWQVVQDQRLQSSEGDDKEKNMRVDLLKRLAERLRLFYGVTRTNIKTLGAQWERNQAEGVLELRRVYYRAQGLRDWLLSEFGSETAALRAIYDLSEVYDLWFAKRLESLSGMLECLSEHGDEIRKKNVNIIKEVAKGYKDFFDSLADENKPAADVALPEGLPKREQLIALFRRGEDKDNAARRAELRAAKALYELQEIDGWEQLLGKGK